MTNAFKKNKQRAYVKCQLQDKEAVRELRRGRKNDLGLELDEESEIRILVMVMVMMVTVIIYREVLSVTQNAQQWNNNHSHVNCCC